MKVKIEDEWRPVFERNTGRIVVLTVERGVLRILLKDIQAVKIGNKVFKEEKKK